MQVQTQAAQHTHQIEDVLAACNSMCSQTEEQAHKFEEWVLDLEDRTRKGFEWAEWKFALSKTSTSISKAAEATILWLTEDIEKSKQNTEQSNECLWQSLEAKQHEEFEQIRKDAIDRFKQNVEQSNELLWQSLEAKQHEEFERIQKDTVDGLKQNTEQSNELLWQSLEAKQHEELEKIQKDTVEAKHLAMATSQQQLSAFMSILHSFTTQPHATGPPARKGKFLGDQNSLNAMSDTNVEMSSDDERVPLPKIKGKGKMADHNGGKVRSLFLVCQPQYLTEFKDSNFKPICVFIKVLLQGCRHVQWLRWRQFQGVTLLSDIWCCMMNLCSMQTLSQSVPPPPRHIPRPWGGAGPPVTPTKLPPSSAAAGWNSIESPSQRESLAILVIISYIQRDVVDASFSRLMNTLGNMVTKMCNLMSNGSMTPRSRCSLRSSPRSSPMKKPVDRSHEEGRTEKLVRYNNIFFQAQSPKLMSNLVGDISVLCQKVFQCWQRPRILWIATSKQGWYCTIWKGSLWSWSYVTIHTQLEHGHIGGRVEHHAV